MRLRLFIYLALFFSLAGVVCAQANWPGESSAWALSTNEDLPVLLSSGADGDDVLPAVPVSLPRMAPELALQAYRGRAVLQAADLVSYSATSLIRAELPETHQSGEYEVHRNYSAPHHQLTFQAVRFTGDNFVKSNVILRVLQSEAEHVQKDDPAANAISPANYKFSYKGTTEMHGRIVHVYQVKPRQKRAGLFKGRIYLNVYSGSMVRAEGKLVKSPSWFVKKLEFVQDYADINSFTFPVHIHSEAQARIVGRAVVDIYNSDYQPVSSVEQAETSPAL